MTLQIPALQLLGEDCLGRRWLLIVMLIFVRITQKFLIWQSS